MPFIKENIKISFTPWSQLFIPLLRLRQIQNCLRFVTRKEWEKKVFGMLCLNETIQKF